MPTFRAHVAACLAAFLSAFAVPVAAQQDAFRDALIGFHSTLAGDFGDEGPLITGQLEKMASSLATWDETIRGAEQDLRSRLPAAAIGERVRLHMALAEVYINRGRYRDGIREIDGAIQADGKRGALHVLRGLLLETMGRQADAIGAFQRAWEIDSEDPISAYLLASRRTTQPGADEMTPQAILLLKVHERRLQSVPPDRHVPLFAELGLVQDRAALTPAFSPALYADGLTLALEGRYQEAIASFRSAVARDPLVTGGPLLLARLQPGIAKFRDGDAENAIPLLEAAATSTPRSSEIHRILGAAYADAGNDDKSIEQLETAVSLAPDDERASVGLGRALAHAGRVEQAEKVLLNTVVKLPRSTDVHSALADLYESTDRGRNALHQLEVASTFTVLAGKGALYYRLADLEHRHLEYERVIDPLARRVRLNPNDARVHTDLGLAYTRVGRIGDALVELVVASLLGPDDPEALTAIGQIHFDAGRYAAAESVVRHAIALEPSLVQARYLLGHALARLGRTNESKEQLAEYDRLRAAANDEQRRSFEIDVLRQQAVRETTAGRHDAAVAIWQQVVEREPKRPDHRIALAVALIKAGRSAAAVEHLEAAASLGADIDVYRQLAEVYETLGRASESATARQKYLQLVRERRRAADK